MMMALTLSTCRLAAHAAAVTTTCRPRARPQPFPVRKPGHGHGLGCVERRAGPRCIVAAATTAARPAVEAVLRALSTVPGALNPVQQRVLQVDFADSGEGLTQLLVALHLAAVDGHKLHGSLTPLVLRFSFLAQASGLHAQYARGKRIHEVLRCCPLFHFYDEEDTGLWVRLDVDALPLLPPWTSSSPELQHEPVARAQGAPAAALEQLLPGSGAAVRQDLQLEATPALAAARSSRSGTVGALEQQPAGVVLQGAQGVAGIDQQIDRVADSLVPITTPLDPQQRAAIRELAAFLAAFTRKGPHGPFAAPLPAAVLHLQRMKALGRLEGKYNIKRVASLAGLTAGAIAVLDPPPAESTGDAGDGSAGGGAPQAAQRMLHLAVADGEAAEQLGRLFDAREDMRLLQHPAGQLLLDVSFELKRVQGDGRLQAVAARHLALAEGQQDLLSTLHTQLAAMPAFHTSGLHARYGGAKAVAAALQPNPIFRFVPWSSDVWVGLDLQELAEAGLGQEPGGPAEEGEAGATAAAATAAALLPPTTAASGVAAAVGRPRTPLPRLFTAPAEEPAGAPQPSAAAAATSSSNNVSGTPEGLGQAAAVPRLSRSPSPSARSRNDDWGGREVPHMPREGVGGPSGAGAADNRPAPAGPLQQQQPQPGPGPGPGQRPLRKNTLTAPHDDAMPASTPLEPLLRLDAAGRGDGKDEQQQPAQELAPAVRTFPQQQAQHEREQLEPLLRALPPRLRPFLEPYTTTVDGDNGLAASGEGGASSSSSPGGDAGGSGRSGSSSSGSGSGFDRPRLSQIVIDEGRPVELHLVAPARPASLSQPTHIVLLPDVQVRSTAVGLR